MHITVLYILSLILVQNPNHASLEHIVKKSCVIRLLLSSSQVKKAIFNFDVFHFIRFRISFFTMYSNRTTVKAIN